MSVLLLAYVGWSGAISGWCARRLSPGAGRRNCRPAGYQLRKPPNRKRGIRGDGATSREAETRVKNGRGRRLVYPAASSGLSSPRGGVVSTDCASGCTRWQKISRPVSRAVHSPAPFLPVISRPPLSTLANPPGDSPFARAWAGKPTANTTATPINAASLMKRSCFLVMPDKLAYAGHTCIDADQSPPSSKRLMPSRTTCETASPAVRFLGDLALHREVLSSMRFVCKILPTPSGRIR